MADTRRVLSALLALFADNTAGNISPQDMRDLAVSVVSNRSFANKTATFIPDADNQLVLFDSTGGAIDVTLPAAASFPGKVFAFKKIAGTNDVRVLPPGGQEIDAMSWAYITATRIFISNGVQWYDANRSLS